MEKKDAIPTERYKRKDDHDYVAMPAKKPRIEEDSQPQLNSAESSNIEMCTEPSHKSEGCRCQPVSNSAESSNLEKCAEPSPKSEGCHCEPPALSDITNKSEDQRLNSEQDSCSPPNSEECDKEESPTLSRYPVIWAGFLALKKDLAKVQMHFVSGNESIARASLPVSKDCEFPVIRINKRMKLEQTQIQQFCHKLQMVGEHCILVALPSGKDPKEVIQQAVNIHIDFINYLRVKEAAGIVDVNASDSGKRTHVIHMFPSCPLIDGILGAHAPDLVNFGSNVPHFVVVIAIV